MNTDQRKIHRNEFIRINKRFEDKYFPKVHKAIKSKVSSLIEVIREHGIEAGKNYLHTDLANKELSNTVKSLYQEVGLRYARKEYRRQRQEIRTIGFPKKKGVSIHNDRDLTKQADVSTSGFIETKGFGFNEKWVAFILQYLQQFLIQKITFSVNETTRDKLLDVLQEGVAEGLSIDEMVNRLDDLPFTKYQAARIVRTEINRAANVGTMAGVDTSEYEMNKEWIAAHDKRTRGNPYTGQKDHADHWDLDAQVIGFDEKFKDKRNGDELEFPGDPKASAASTVNCFLPDEKTNIDLRYVKKAFRSFYNGKVVTIKTSSGNSFTCTPNHPILTLRGWIKAGELTSMDNLIKGDFLNNRICRVDPEINNMPTTFKKVYSSLNKRFATVRKMPSGLDFYGDVPTGDIDIVNTESELPNWIKTVLAKVFQNDVLANSNFRTSYLFCNCSLAMAFYKEISRKITNNLVRFRGKLLSFFEGYLSHSQIHGLATVSLSNSCFTQSNDNCASANIKVFGDRFNAKSVFVQRDNGINIDINSFDNSFFNSMSFKDCVNYFSATADTISDLIGRKAGQIEVDNVIGVISHKYSGYVYTLETNNQMYEINGYVARNCRCSVAPIGKRDENGFLVPKPQPAQVIPMGGARQMPIAAQPFAFLFGQG